MKMLFSYTPWPNRFITALRTGTIHILLMRSVGSDAPIQIDLELLLDLNGSDE